MRYSMEDYHRQDVAASCIFLATKTEECGRKLRDVARICQVKVTGKDVPSESKVIPPGLFGDFVTNVLPRRKSNSARLQSCLLKKHCWRPCVSILLSKAHTANSWTCLMPTTMTL